MKDTSYNVIRSDTENRAYYTILNVLKRHVRNEHLVEIKKAIREYNKVEGSDNVAKYH